MGITKTATLVELNKKELTDLINISLDINSVYYEIKKNDLVYQLHPLVDERKFYTEIAIRKGSERSAGYSLIEIFSERSHVTETRMDIDYSFFGIYPHGTDMYMRIFKKGKEHKGD